MGRKFEKISKEEFKKSAYLEYSDVYDEDYDDLELPSRGSKFSAGYDFHAPFKIKLFGKECVKIPTLVKADMEEDEVLLIDVRSSLGFKHNIRLANTIGVVDKDYYNNANNEGHIFIKLYNPNYEDIIIEKGERFAQGIFIKYLKTEDDKIEAERVGGLGSTGR